MTISELAEILVTDRTTMARNLLPLERENYLNITHGATDKRRKYVKITPEGEEVLEKALQLCPRGVW